MRNNRGSSFPSLTDLVRREDDARRASMRAEARLTHDFTHAGGIEEAKRYSLSKHKRERDQIQQELNNIKTSYKRSNAMMMQNPGNMKLANPQFAEDLEEQEYLSSLNITNESEKGKQKKYGRNYFGYKSEPGSHRPQFEHIKAIKEKYSPVKNYYEYKGPKVMDKRTREKLLQQQKQNLTVQERVKSFAKIEKKKRDPLQGYRILPATAPEKKEVAATADEEEEKKPEALPEVNGNGLHLPKVDDYDAKKIDTKKAPSPGNGQAGLARRRGPPVAASSTVETSTEPVTSPSNSDKENKNASGTLPELKEEPDDITEPTRQLVRRVTRLRSTSPTSSQQDNMSVVGSLYSHPMHRSMKPKTALDLVFDADKYAPDGRLRTMHCMPDVNQAYKEARQARYVRTRYRRDLEKELTVNEIFDR